MFTTLNHRINRTLIAAIIPFSMSISMAGNTFADMRPTDTSINQILTARTYSVSVNGTTIDFQMDRVTGNAVSGTILIGTAEYPFSAQADGQTLEGMFVQDGKDCPFTATIEGAVMHLDYAGMHLVLQQVA